MALNCRFSKIQFMSLKGDILQLGFQMVEGHCKVMSQDLDSLIGSQRPPPCCNILFGLYSQAASLYGILHFCFLANNPETF